MCQSGLEESAFSLEAFSPVSAFCLFTNLNAPEKDKSDSDNLREGLT